MAEEMATLFKRLGQPPSTKKAQGPTPEQRLLDWLQTWNKENISLREIHIYGPRSVRGREQVVSTAETLVKYGWLVPAKKHRRDMHKWVIVRRPIVAPDVAT
jgi:hypothetical protein